MLVLIHLRSVPPSQTKPLSPLTSTTFSTSWLFSTTTEYSKPSRVMSGVQVKESVVRLPAAAHWART
ncbi:unknown [Akkermansia sp. CAG:344]|nr:unknown [Akkermansia sp. CAG:344]